MNIITVDDMLTYTIIQGVINVYDDPTVTPHNRRGSLHKGTKFRAFPRLLIEESPKPNDKPWYWARINDVLIDGEYNLIFYGCYVPISHVDGTNALAVEDAKSEEEDRETE
jgi:hypothetical protein